MYVSETSKIRPRIQKYLNGSILDIGTNTDKVSPEAIGVDIRKASAVDIVVSSIETLSQNASIAAIKPFDVVYSSHCLEHIKDDQSALLDWASLVKPGGLLILYLPDVRFYTEHNPEHVQNYTYDAFIYNFELFTGLKIIESGMDVGPDKYSFFVVAKKTAT